MKGLVVVYILFLVACASGQDKKPFDIVAEYFGAKVSYTTVYSNAIGKKKLNFLDLNIKGGPYITTEPPKPLSAYAAVLLFTNLSDEDAAKYTHLKINLFSSETQKETSNTYTYDVETIRNVALLSANFKKVKEMLLNGTTHNLYDLFIEKSNASELKEFIAYVEELRKERSGIKAVKLLGVTSLIDDNTKERFLGFNGQIEWGNSDKTVVMIETSEDPSIEGINFIDIK